MTDRENLRSLLKARIGEKRINRSSSIQKEKVLTGTMKDMGIDKDKFMKLLKLVKSQEKKPT